MSYAYPSVPEVGQRIRTVLATYGRAGGRDACLLLHAEDGRAAIAQLARRRRGLPARVIPLEVHHVAAVGLDVWLAALALGRLAGGGAGDRRRGAAVPRSPFQAMDIADRIAQALGYQGQHFRVFDGADSVACDAALWSWPAALPVRAAATFALTADKRTTVALAIEHLALHAPVPQREIALPAGAPSAPSPSTATPAPCASPAWQLPRRRDPRHPGKAAAALRRGEVRAVRAVRDDLPGARDRAHPAAQSRAGSEGAAGGERGPRSSSAFPAASRWHAKMVEAMLGRLAGHSMFAAPRRARPAADVRRLPRDRHDEGRAWRQRPRPLTGPR